MIIFVHMLKTAGTSFRRLIEGAKDVNDLDYIGITEESPKSVQLFARMFDVTIPEAEETKPASEYGDASSILQEQGIFAEIKRSQQPK